MPKVIRVSDETYLRLLKLKHKLELEREAALSFDDVVRYLLNREEGKAEEALMAPSA